MQKKIKAAFVNFDKANFRLKDSSCILPISVGQHYHEDDKFAATIKLINDTFRSCMLVICDSLQRHTLSAYKSHEDRDDLHRYANLLGDNWFERNNQNIKQLSIPYRIIRWDQWLNHQLYTTQEQAVDEFYEKNEKYRAAVNSFAEEFFLRHEKRGVGDINLNKLKNASVGYFREESIIFTLWAKEEINFLLYPGKCPEGLMLIHEHFVKSENSLAWLRIRFRD